MAGPNLEVFKFGCYVFFPIFAMLKFGDPEWYDAYVKPYGEVIWPKYETTHKPPKTSSELQKELERLKLERQARRERIDSAAVHQTQTFSGPIATSSRPEISEPAPMAEQGRLV